MLPKKKARASVTLVIRMDIPPPRKAFPIRSSMLPVGFARFARTNSDTRTKASSTPNPSNKNGICAFKLLFIRPMYAPSPMQPM